MRVAFIGIGLMGKPMAINMLKAGHQVTVVNRSQGKVDELVEMGAIRGTTPANACANAEVICLCLVGDQVVEQIITGENGVLAGAPSGSLIMDHSTVHPDFARRMATTCWGAGITYIDAPVSGTGPYAWEGKLTVMVGGDTRAMDYVRPLLDAVSMNAKLMGPVGSGNTAKLINNMVKDINQLGVMEAFVLAAKLGMDPASMYAVMSTGSGGSRQLERIAPKILNRTFEQTSFVDTNIKDQHLIGWLADKAELALPLRDAAAAGWVRAAELGLGRADPSEAIKVLEAEAGVEVSGDMGAS